jgi:ABC-type enterochelin transport system permease subunit
MVVHFARRLVDIVQPSAMVVTIEVYPIVEMVCPVRVRLAMRDSHRRQIPAVHLNHSSFQ